LIGSFRGHHGSIDCVALLSDEHFVSGGDDGAINYWSTKRKKPICVVRNAHAGTWITALGALINSDVFVSGAADGHLRIWRLINDKARIEQFHNIKVVSI
jgi:ribosomal RNA-processing protein 9